MSGKEREERIGKVEGERSWKLDQIEVKGGGRGEERFDTDAAAAACIHAVARHRLMQQHLSMRIYFYLCNSESN